jgi:LysR family glycine cleavage system transcriptional activator
MTRLVEMANATNERVSVVGGEVSIPNGYYLMRPRSKRSKRPQVLLFEDWLFKEFSDES